MMTMSGIYYMLISWYPTYLKGSRGTRLFKLARLASLVLAAGALGCFFGGWLTDWLVKKTGNRRWGRTASAWVVRPWRAGEPRQPVHGIHCSGVSVRRSCLPWCSDPGSRLVGQRYPGQRKTSGALFGLMNMIGGLAHLFAALPGQLRRRHGQKGLHRPSRMGPGFLCLRGCCTTGNGAVVLDRPAKDGRVARERGLDRNRVNRRSARPTRW